MVSIIIPVYNQVSYTKTFLSSIKKYTTSLYEVIVIDNGSFDETQEYLSKLNWVNVIRNNENLGCAKAWNQGIEIAKGEWLCVLNNDIVVTREWLNGMLYSANKFSLDIVSPVRMEGELNYPLETFARLFIYLNRERIFSGFNGSCFLMKKKIIEKVGKFDEQFKIGKYEDSDFLIRVLNNRLKTGISGASLVHHYVGKTTCVVDDMQKIEEENRKLFIEKWGKEPDFKKTVFSRRLYEKAILKSFKLIRKVISSFNKFFLRNLLTKQR